MRYIADVSLIVMLFLFLYSSTLELFGYEQNTLLGYFMVVVILLNITAAMSRTEYVRKRRSKSETINKHEDLPIIVSLSIGIGIIAGFIILNHTYIQQMGLCAMVIASLSILLTVVLSWLFHTEPPPPRPTERKGNCE